MMFEGLTMPGPNDMWTNNTYLQMRNIQKINLDGRFTKEGRKLWMTKLFRKPLWEMRHKVSCLTQNNCSDFDGEEASNLKYLIYSAHDDQLVNVWKYLAPNNLQEDWADFASNMQLELFANDDCLAEGGAQDESCFFVNARYNGNEMAFDLCEGDNNETGCSYTDFLDYMSEIAFYQEGYEGW